MPCGGSTGRARLDNDRAEDAWEPLLAIADAACGEWPARGRAAAVVLNGASDTDTTGVALLRAIWAVFDTLADDKILTVNLL